MCRGLLFESPKGQTLAAFDISGNFKIYGFSDDTGAFPALFNYPFSPKPEGYETLEEYVESGCHGAKIRAWTGLDPGFYHPRMWRGSNAVVISRNKKDQEFESSCAAARILLDELFAIFRTVEPRKENFSVFGHSIRNLLMLSCMEIEAGWVAVLKENGMSKTRYSTTDYVKLCDLMVLPFFEFNLPQCPDLGTIRPFEGWCATAPTQSLDFYHAYNSTKHDRGANFECASLEIAYKAFAGCVIMILAQFGSYGLERHPTLGTLCNVKLVHEFDKNLYFIPQGGIGSPAQTWFGTLVPAFAAQSPTP